MGNRVSWKERALNRKSAIPEFSLFLTTDHLRNLGQVGITCSSSHLKILLTFYRCDLLKANQRRKGERSQVVAKK